MKTISVFLYKLWSLAQDHRIPPETLSLSLPSLSE